MYHDQLTVSLVQYAPRWEDVPYNLERLTEMLRQLDSSTHLIVLPEMFASGFSMNVATIGSDDDRLPALQWMRQQAVDRRTAIAGTAAVPADKRYRNRMYWVHPAGVVDWYDKHHLFTMACEHLHFTAGTERKQFLYMGWTIQPAVCYDLRFPAWCRNDRKQPYDLLICCASWPAARSSAWLTLLQARALENQCYVVGVNRVGTDGNGLPHDGSSAIFGPKGELIGRLPENEEAVATFTLSLTVLYDFRKKFPVLNDMDDIQIKI